MSIRDVITFAVILGSVPFCFTRPWIGMLVFSWLGYMNPHRYTWGIAYDFPFAMIIAVVTLIGFVATSEKDKFYMERETVLILLIWILVTLTSLSAFYPSKALEMWQKTSKIFLMCLIIIPLFIDKEKLRYLLLTIALSLGLLGVKGGIFAIATGGAHNVRGPDRSFIAGEGDFALALNMALPLLFYLAKNEDNKKMKIFLYFVFAFSILSVIFTYRRGGFIGLAVVMSMLFLKANKKFISIFMLLLALIIASTLLTDKWFERMETIKTYEEDGSSMRRINAWKMAINVAKDRPLKGAGFDGLTWPTIDLYSPHPSLTAGDVHSIYFEMLGEQGFIGLGLFIMLLLSALLSVGKIKKTFKNNPSHKWLCNYADMLQISIIAYMAGGVFLGRAYFDLFYHLIVIIVVIKVLARKEFEGLNEKTAIQQQ